MRKFISISLLFLCANIWAENRLTLPQDYKNGVMYEQVKRGNVIEDIYAPQSAIDAVKKGNKIPENTLIAMEEYANQNGQKGKLNRIIVMKKMKNDWQFNAFLSNRRLNKNENPQRCYQCHKDSISGEDIVFTLDKMKSF
ncbi:MAG: cytochrome P460 family protein [Neisseriaceae bacterium]|nr:cytochrome P460 family protein [Neisseriaceae bacterium]